MKGTWQLSQELQSGETVTGGCGGWQEMRLGRLVGLRVISHSQNMTSAIWSMAAVRAMPMVLR